jgi:hypothetical protein
MVLESLAAGLLLTPRGLSEAAQWRLGVLGPALKKPGLKITTWCRECPARLPGSGKSRNAMARLVPPVGPGE